MVKKYKDAAILVAVLLLILEAAAVDRLVARAFGTRTALGAILRLMDQPAPPPKQAPAQPAPEVKP